MTVEIAGRRHAVPPHRRSRSPTRRTTQTGTFPDPRDGRQPKGTLRPNQHVRAGAKPATRRMRSSCRSASVQQAGAGISSGSSARTARPRSPGRRRRLARRQLVRQRRPAAGDQVVVDGAQRLAQGATVTVVAKGRVSAGVGSLPPVARRACSRASSSSGRSSPRSSRSSSCSPARSPCSCCRCSSTRTSRRCR